MADGDEPVEREEVCGLHAAPPGGGHERRPAGVRRDGRGPRSGGRLQHPFRGLHQRQNHPQVRRWRVCSLFPEAVGPLVVKVA